MTKSRLPWWLTIVHTSLGRYLSYLALQHLHRVVKCMKESEMESAPPEWSNVCLGYEIHNRLYSHRANYKLDRPFPTNTNEDPTDLDELVRLTNPVVMPAFGSCIVKGRTTKTMMTDTKLNVMTQAPYAEDEASLPVGLYVMRNRIEMNPGSRTVSSSPLEWHLQANKDVCRAEGGQSGDSEYRPQGRGVTRIAPSARNGR